MNQDNQIIAVTLSMFSLSNPLQNKNHIPLVAIYNNVTQF